MCAGTLFIGSVYSEMSGVVSKMTQTFVDQILEVCDKTENKKRLEETVIDPMVCYILDRLYPYIFATAAFFILMLITSIIIMVQIFRR